MDIDFGDVVGKRKPRRPREPRREHDAYMTPMPLVEAIVARVATYAPNAMRIIEPSCGDGEFVGAIRKAWPDAHIAAIDIRPEVGEKIKALGAFFVAHDFLKLPLEGLSTADLILGNPPYSLHTEFITHALDGMSDGATLAFLLRFNMLVGSMATQEWWTTLRSNGLSPNRQIVDTLPIFPRPSFTGTGTDATEYMLAIFRKGFDNGGRFDPVKWAKPAPRRGRPRKMKQSGDLFRDIQSDIVGE